MNRDKFSPQRYGQDGSGTSEPYGNIYSNIINSSSPRRYGYTSGKQYCVNFRIYYKTIVGEDLGVIGDCDELGNWDTKKCLKLKWTEGHYWVSVQPLYTNRPYFKYKYIQYSDGHIEDGMDRLADVEVLPEVNSAGRVYDVNIRQNNLYKVVQLNDVWESFKVNFSVFAPIESHGDQMLLTGSRDELGNWNKASGPIQMTRSIINQDWLNEKYGEGVMPFEATITLKQQRQSVINHHFSFDYNYTFRRGTHMSGGGFTERSLPRTISFIDPSSYNGQYSHNNQQWNTPSMFIINGVAERCDGNFLQPFNYVELPETDVSIGPFPMNGPDCQLISQRNGCNAVLNLLTDAQMQERGINYQDFSNTLRQNGIHTHIHCQVDDSSPNANAQFFEAAQRLNDLVSNQRLKVFVFCQSGVSRAPTVSLLYFCLFKRIVNWQSVHQSAEFVRQSAQGSVPNEQRVNQIIEDNLEFQSRQVDLDTVEALRRQRLMEEEERKRREEEARILAEDLEAIRRAEEARRSHEESQRRELDLFRQQKELELDTRQSHLHSEEQRLHQLKISIEHEKHRMEEELRIEIQRENAQLDEMRKIRDTIRKEAENFKIDNDNLNHQIQQENISNEKKEEELYRQNQLLQQQLKERREENRLMLGALQDDYNQQIEEEKARLAKVEPEAEQILEMRKREGIRGRVSVSVYLQQQQTERLYQKRNSISGTRMDSPSNVKRKSSTRAWM